MDLILEIFKQFLNNINTGLLLLDNKGKIISYNDGLVAITKRNPNINLNKTGIILTENDSLYRSTIRQFINPTNAKIKKTQARLFTIGDFDDHLSIYIKRYCFENDFLIIIYVYDQSLITINAQSLIINYGLTERQGEIVIYLLKGFNTIDIADIFETSSDSIRTSLKRIYSRVGVESQSQLCTTIASNILLAQSI